MTQILVVDDDEEYAGILRVVLQSHGFDVAMLHDTLGALQYLGQRLPDALILDVMFPENPIAGIEMAQVVRRRFPDLPIVMLTAMNHPSSPGLGSLDIDAALLAVTAFVEKPIDFRLLCDQLDRLLRLPTLGTSW